MNNSIKKASLTLALASCLPMSAHANVCWYAENDFSQPLTIEVYDNVDNRSLGRIVIPKSGGKMICTGESRDGKADINYKRLGNTIWNHEPAIRRNDRVGVR